MGKKVEGMVGRVFGRLTVIAETEKRGPGGVVMYLCRCSCGKTTTVSGTCLRSGETVSCGCYNHDVITKFGNAVYKEKLYSVWASMKARCGCSTDKFFHNYGGRGIKVCDEWREDYRAFKAWAYENGYRPGLWIDRIDNDGDYKPSNCRWATTKEQARNKRTTVFVEYMGNRMCLADAAELSGIKPATLARRIELGWPSERLFAPVDARRSHPEEIRRALAGHDGSRVEYDKEHPGTDVTITRVEVET